MGRFPVQLGKFFFFFFFLGPHIYFMMQTVEKRPREMMLRREFTNAVMYLNEIFSEEKQLVFVHWDFHKFAKT